MLLVLQKASSSLKDSNMRWQHWCTQVLAWTNRSDAAALRGQRTLPAKRAAHPPRWHGRHRSSIAVKHTHTLARCRLLTTRDFGSTLKLTPRGELFPQAAATSGSWQTIHLQSARSFHHRHISMSAPEINNYQLMLIAFAVSGFVLELICVDEGLCSQRQMVEIDRNLQPLGRHRLQLLVTCSAYLFKSKMKRVLSTTSHGQTPPEPFEQSEATACGHQQRVGHTEWLWPM